MEKEIIKQFNTKLEFDTCSKSNVDTATLPGKVILEQELVGGVNETLDATANNRDLDTDGGGGGRVSLITGKFGTYGIESSPDQLIDRVGGAFPGTSEFTIEGYFKITEVIQTSKNFYMVLWDSVGSSRIMIYVNSANKVGFYLRDSGSVLVNYVDSTVLSIDTWYKFAVVREDIVFPPSKEIRCYLDTGSGLTLVHTGSIFTGFDCTDFSYANYTLLSPASGKGAVDEIRVSDKTRTVLEMADPGAGGYTPDGNTYALYHCEEVEHGAVWQYKTIGTITSPEIINNGKIMYPEILGVIGSIPTNTSIEFRYKYAEFATMGAWSDWIDYATFIEKIYADIFMARKFQIELRLQTSDVSKTPEVDKFILYGEKLLGDEPMFLEFNKLITAFRSVLVSAGFSTKERLYDNRLVPFWETEPDTWILQRYEAGELPINDGWRVITVGDATETIVAGIFNTNTTNGAWGKDNIGMVTGQQIQIRFRKDNNGATERRGFEFEFNNGTKKINLYFWNNEVSFNYLPATGYTIDTSVWHIYQIYIGGEGVDELELRVDGVPTIRTTGTATGASPGGVHNGWEYPDNSYASAPYENMQLDYLRSGEYEEWLPATITLENTHVKNLYAKAEIDFDGSVDVYMAYIGKIINVKEWSLQYWNGSIWKDWFVEVAEDQFLKKYWWDSGTGQVTAEKVRLLIHERIDSGAYAKIGELYVGNIVYQAPDTPQNLEDKDEGKKGNYETGSGKVISWSEYDSNFGAYLFNLISDRHQEKFREFYDQKTFVILLEPTAKIDRFFKATWFNKWDSKYSTGFRQVGWDINMTIKQTV